MEDPFVLHALVVQEQEMLGELLQLQMDVVRACWRRSLWSISFQHAGGVDVCLARLTFHASLAPECLHPAPWEECTDRPLSSMCSGLF